MNIYKISQTVNKGYDTYDSAVVIAADEDSARLMHPEEKDGYASSAELWLCAERGDSTWAYISESVEVEYLGKADPYITKPCFIVCSYNTG